MAWSFCYDGVEETDARPLGAETIPIRYLLDTPLPLYGNDRILILEDCLTRTHNLT